VIPPHFILDFFKIFLIIYKKLQEGIKMKPMGRVNLFLFVLTLFFGVFIYTIYKADAKVLPVFPVSNETDYYENSFSAAFDGTKYLVPIAGCMPDLSECFLKAIFIDKSGNKVGETTIKTVSGPHIVGPNTAYAPGSDKYLVVWLEDYPSNKIKGRFVRPDGTLAGSELTIATFTSEPSEGYVSYGGGKFLVVYNKPYTYNNETDDAVYGRFISSNGTLGTEFRISSLWGKVDFNQVAFNGTNFLVVYREDRENKNVLGRFVSPSSGGPVGNELIINQDNYYSDNPSAVFFDGEKFFVVYPNELSVGFDVDGVELWGFYGRFVFSNGTVSLSEIPITTTKSHKILPLIAFDGSKYLITWSDGRNCGGFFSNCTRTGYDIYGRYISKNGTPLGDEFLVYASLENELGGFVGRTSRGKAFGLILGGISSYNEGVIFSDTYGSFWVSFGYEVFAPDKKEKVKAGNKYTIRWRAPANAKKFDLWYSNDRKQTWNLIAQDVTAQRWKVWNVPSQNGRKPSSYIKVVAKDDAGNILKTFYSRPFSIEVAKITFPDGAWVLWNNQTVEVTWETYGLNATVAKTVVQYSIDGGQTWRNIGIRNGNPGYIRWNIPSDINSPICRVRIIFKNSAGQNIAITENDAVFEIITLY